MVFNFLRFRQRPPGKEAPPSDRVDVFHDSTTGKMVARNARNEAVLFDAEGGAATWGAITGTLTSQTDLTAALNAKAASSHTHVSADITDVSFGGNANLDGNKVVKFGTIGEIYASYAIRIADPGSGYIQLEHLTSPTSGHAAKFPDKSGAVGILPIYVDSAAANAVVSIGDAWWDLTLNKARVRLT